VCCPCTTRQLFPETVLGSGAQGFETAGKTLHEDAGIRLWTLDDQVLIASIKTKMHAISPEVAEGLQLAVDMAEKDYQGVVIWSGDDPFSAGADLQAMLPAFMAVGVSAIDEAEPTCSRPCCACATPTCRSSLPSAAWRWAAAARLAVHSARRVVAMESYIGLVEVGVGLVPGAGGLAYIARRAAENSATSTDKDLLKFVTEGFTAAAMAKVGTSALESRKLGYLLDSDLIVPNKDELLFVALNEARAMFNGGYRRRTSASSPWPGAMARPPSRASWSTCATAASSAQHDFHIASLIAGVVTGGDVDANTMVTEEYLMTLERKAFCSLLTTPRRRNASWAC
jgi:3-hydroxyacyl-CoA dehydrogenase